MPHSDYLDFPPAIQTKIAAIETELDATWPGWRQRSPFNHLEYAALARVKWLLKRHSLLTARSSGLPAPRDWDVVIVKGKKAGQCFAHPVLPVVEDAETTREPPPVYALEVCDDREQADA